MRSLAAAFCCLLVGSLFACSSDSSGLGGAAGASVGASGGAAAGGSASASAGAGGSSAAGAGNVGGSSSEGINVTGPLDTTGGAGASGGTASEVRPDAGELPVTRGVCPPGPFAANPVPAGAVPEELCSDLTFTFTEGPVWFDERNTLFFSDFSIGNAASNFNGRILTFTPGGECAELIPDAGTNGLAIAPDGNLLGCRHSDQTLTVFDLTTREPTVLVADNDGASFNTTNDVAVRSDGNMYFTDPTFLLGNRDSELPARAYRRDPSGALSVIDQTGNTNGISLSPDETRLYLSHLGGPSNIIVFDVDAAGAVSNPQPFINVGSDGMVVDCAGNLYITQGGVRIYNPEGELITTIAAPGAANVAFGGPERRTLYITAEDQLLAVELAIPGMPY